MVAYDKLEEIYIDKFLGSPEYLVMKEEMRRNEIENRILVDGGLLNVLSTESGTL